VEAHAHACTGTRSLSALGPAGALPLLQSASEWPGVMRFSHGSSPLVARGVEPSQPRPPPAVAPHEAFHPAVASDGFNQSSLFACASRRFDPRWEPDAVAPLVRICGGGQEQSWSLLRLTRSNPGGIVASLHAMLTSAGAQCTSALPIRCRLRPPGAGRVRAPGASVPESTSACSPPALDLASSPAISICCAKVLACFYGPIRVRGNG
jgi:hypothetical protein